MNREIFLTSNSLTVPEQLKEKLPIMDLEFEKRLLKQQNGQSFVSPMCSVRTDYTLLPCIKCIHKCPYIKYILNSAFDIPTF